MMMRKVTSVPYMTQWTQVTQVVLTQVFPQMKMMNHQKTLMMV